MDQLNDMLNKIMDDPQSMEQLKAAARALGLDPDGPPPAGMGGDAPAPGPGPAPDLGALAGMLGGGGAPALDPAALRLIQGAAAKLNQPDKNIDLLRALKPHFSPDRGARVDHAIRLLQLLALLPVLRESGILGDLGNLFGGGRKP